MKEICPHCGGNVKTTQGSFIPRDAMVLLDKLANTHPLRMGRILEIISNFPDERTEELLRMVEDILGR